jgi:hypothetical protein
MFSSTSNVIVIPWMGIEPTYQKQQVILGKNSKKISYIKSPFPEERIFSLAITSFLFNL